MPKVGNALPTLVTPMSLLPDGGAARIIVMRRFVGRVRVIAGLAMVLLFALARFAAVRSVAPWFPAGAVGATLGAVVWLNLRPSRRET